MGNPSRWLALCLLMLGCQDLEVEKEAGEPCTRDSQCVEGLVCLAGVCLEESEAGGDAAYVEGEPSLEPETGEEL